MAKLKEKVIRTSISMAEKDHENAKELASLMSIKQNKPVSIAELFRHLLDGERKRVEKDLNRLKEIRGSL